MRCIGAVLPPYAILEHQVQFAAAAAKSLRFGSFDLFLSPDQPARGQWIGAQDGYVNAIPPSITDARDVLGGDLTKLWISGSAKSLLDHYFTSERSKIYMAMTVTESGPVSLCDPYSAFTLPLMDSGSVFGGYYGFVKGGIW